MKISAIFRRFALRRGLNSEQRLRERCIRYAGGENIILASNIYRFIVRGTGVRLNRETGEYEEYVYPNLEEVGHLNQTLQKRQSCSDL